MSLLQVWVGDHRVLVAVDTMAVAADGSRIECSKMIPLPHVPAVLAIRGNSPMLSAAFHQAFSFSDDFDKLDASMPAALAAIHEQFRAHLEQHGQVGFLWPRQEVVLAGRSPKRRGMVAVLYTRADAGEWAREEINSTYVQPWAEGYQPLNDRAGAIGCMVKAARAQVQHWRAHKDEYPDAKHFDVGGRLLVADIRRAPRPQLLVSDLCDL